MKKILTFLILALPYVLFAQEGRGRWDYDKRLENSFLNTARADMSDSTDVAKTAAGDSAREIVSDTSAILLKTAAFADSFAAHGGQSSTGNPDSLGDKAYTYYDSMKIFAVDSITLRERLDGISMDSIDAYFAFDKGGVTDISGQGNHGALVNAVWNANPDSFKAGTGGLSFNGSNAYVELTTNGLLTRIANNNIGTIGFWIKPTLGQNGFTLEISRATANTSCHLYLATTGIIEGALVMAGVDKWDFTINTALTANVWTQIILTHNGTAPVLWKDGVIAPITFSISTDKTVWLNDMVDLNTLRFGQRKYNSGAGDLFYNGWMDEMFFSSRTWTASEIRRMYSNQSKDKFGTATIDSLELRALHLTGKLTSDSSAVFNKSVQADTFVTTSEKAISDKAVERVKQIKFKPGTEHGNYAELDHSSLPADMQVAIQERYYKDRVTGEEYSRKDIWKTVSDRTVKDVQIVDGIAGFDTVDVIREVATGTIFTSQKDYLEKRFKPIDKEETGLNLNRYIFELGRAIELINARQDSIVNAMR